MLLWEEKRLWNGIAWGFNSVNLLPVWFGAGYSNAFACFILISNHCWYKQAVYFLSIIKIHELSIAFPFPIAGLMFLM